MRAKTRMSSSRCLLPLARCLLMRSLALCIITLQGAVLAQEQPVVSAAELDIQVRDLLRLGVEEMAPREMWLDLPIEAVDVLIGVVRDPETMPLYRNRAVAALAHYADDRVPGFLMEFATSDAYDSGLRMSALGTLAQWYPDQALAPLTDAASASDAYERRRAAMILGGMVDLRAGEILHARLEAEQVGYVRVELERALARHQTLVARRNTDALSVSVEFVADSTLPPSATRWRILVVAPASIQGDDQLLRLQLTAQAPDALVFEGGNAWERELAPGDTWELQVDTRKTNPELDGSFRLFVQEAGAPASARRIDVAEERR